MADRHPTAVVTGIRPMKGMRLMKFLSSVWPTTLWVVITMVTTALSVSPAFAQSPERSLPAMTVADCDRPTPDQLLIEEHAMTAETLYGRGAVSATTPNVGVIPQAIWFDERTLRWPAAQSLGATRFQLIHGPLAGARVEIGRTVTGPHQAYPLVPVTAPLPEAVQQRFRHVAAGLDLRLVDGSIATLKSLQIGQLLVVALDPQNRVMQVTRTQVPGALDALYADAESVPNLGVSINNPGASAQTRWRLWAPTAATVAVCVYRDSQSSAETLLPMVRDTATGVWSGSRSGDLSGRTYLYLIDVFVGGRGWMRNRVTDPYSVSLTADSVRSAVLRLDDPALMPTGWRDTPRPQRVQAPTDLVIYELHVRDFSINDSTVAERHRGAYLAFTDTASNGMKHLQRLSAAGMTDVHLLPAFDFATVPEVGCQSPTYVDGPPDSDYQQARVMAVANRDCFNWGYDPLHFNAPEGSYSTDADDPAVRIREFRAMVMALHQAGLRVGMDVVYNHMSASGQNANSVLDRIVPGYYHRLNAVGAVETSTCCDNTATEHRMMGRLMIDSTVLWVREHRIDSFRFDLMGHQPREVMERVQKAVDAAAGQRVHLIGEGWNFGEVADGARFRQASQLELQGSGIATFSDRARDAVRGGGHGDNAEALVRNQGWLNGLGYDPNALTQPGVAGARSAADATTALLSAADMVRVGLAGSLRNVSMVDRQGRTVPLRGVSYNGQPGGYVQEPGEVVNYVDNHDNQTLFDLNALKLPETTSRDDRARVQVLGAAVVAFSQGLAYFHAGIDTLRSKSGDRNSYDSGDWFNRIDWSLKDNHWGTGLPPIRDNQNEWPVLRPRLANPLIKPGPEQIRFTRDAFEDLLRIRASSALFRLRSAAEVQQRLRFVNTGPQQVPTVVAAVVDGRGIAGAGFQEIAYFINVDKEARTVRDERLRGDAWQLHPVHLAPTAADVRPREQARLDAATGAATVPARSAVVWVRR